MQLVNGRRYRFIDTPAPRRQPFVRLAGRDQAGRPVEAEIYWPGEDSRLGAPGEPGDRRVGDAALGDLDSPARHDGWVQVSCLAAWARQLDEFYGRR